MKLLFTTGDKLKVTWGNLTKTDIVISTSQVNDNYVYNLSNGCSLWHLKTLKEPKRFSYYNKDKKLMSKWAKAILINQIQKKQNVSDNNFYTLLGYDILITNKFEPVLIEINDNPTMTYDYYHKVKKGLTPKNAPTFINK